MTLSFTGERVVPGEVQSDLWNEHQTRYQFAARLVTNATVADIACGTGYGAAELAATAASVVGVDISPSAVHYALAHYARPNLRFAIASADALPFPTASLDRVVAFEVIEHLPRWEGLLEEARRILTPGGVLIVSTPNRIYYEATRVEDGPNPYHVHEFDFSEFRRELVRFFPYVDFYLQNHAQAIVFQPLSAAGGAPAAWIGEGAADPDAAHFLIALCSQAPLPPACPYVAVPTGANVLRERELHIERLSAEILQKDTWLAEAFGRHAELLALHQQQARELEARTRWAQDLDAEVKAARRRIQELDAELAEHLERARQVAAAYEAKVEELDRQNVAKTRWAQQTEERLTAEVALRDRELARLIDALHQAEHTVEERTHWALRLQQSMEDLHEEIRRASASRWLRLGRALGLGPRLRNL